MEKPDVRYARNGDVHIAYATLGEGPLDIVVVPGFVSHLEMGWELPAYVRFGARLARLGRVIAFDKRGTGMSDPVDEVPTLERRMEDVRAVMDAAGSESAVLLGVSEGGPMCTLFAATYPERTRALVLYGAMARSTWAPDYPWASTREALWESTQELVLPSFGTGDNVDIFAPSAAEDAALRQWWGRMERMAASPGMVLKLYETFLETDVRDVLPAVRTPTLVIHRRGDRVVNVGAGRYLADHIPGAAWRELPGRDHLVYAGDVEAVLGEIEEFLTGARATAPEEVERVLATVMFVDIVGSTERAAALGDRRWHELIESYYGVIRGELARARGLEVSTAGDGFFARFDGPARAVRCAAAIAERVRPLGIEVRAGLHTGECETAGDDLRGIAVHIGARIGAIAEPSEVLVSSTVKDLVAGSGIAFIERGRHALRGVPGEWALYRART